MEDDKALYEYLLKFHRYGLAVLSDVPLEMGHVSKLQNRIAFERLTSYGSGYTIEVKDNPSNLAYTHRKLSFHSDLTFYTVSHLKRPILRGSGSLLAGIELWLF